MVTDKKCTINRVLTPQEKLKEIKVRKYVQSDYLTKTDRSWLIARVEQLERVLRYYSEVYPEWNAEVYTRRAKEALNTDPKPE